jgi:CRISPR/Cas system-associated exonuclease Cas4 (RecB family)
MSAPKPKITAWSFSRWNEYESCPQRTHFKVNMKMKEPTGPALVRGTELHKQCEDYLKKGGRIPKELKLIGDVLKDYKKRGAIAEAEFTFTKDWKPTSWFGSDAWCRVKADVTIPPIADSDEPIVEVHDFKSGKLKDQYSEYGLQLDLYALAGLMTYPTAKRAKTSMVFIDHGKVVPVETEYTQKDVKTLTKAWELRVKRMLNDTQFKPTPGDGCRWCTFSKARGGMCAF